jgi:hypothetical protein
MLRQPITRPVPVLVVGPVLLADDEHVDPAVEDTGVIEFGQTGQQQPGQPGGTGQYL